MIVEENGRKQQKTQFLLYGVSIYASLFIYCVFFTLVPPLVTVDGKAHVSDDSEVTLASCFASKSQPAADVMWRLGDLNDSLMTKTNYMLHPDGTFTVVSHLLGAPLRHLNQKTIQCVVTHSTQRTKEYEVDYVINVHCK